MAHKKYENIDLLAFLEEKMKSNTQHYQQDFEIDKDFIRKTANNNRIEDKILLWLSRPNGTLCVREHDAFIRDSAAHQSWRYYAEQTNDRIIAYAIEPTGEKDGKILGNAYELDYRSHVAEVATRSVPIFEVEKTFEDGFSLRVWPEKSTYGFWAPFVEMHGPIVESMPITDCRAEIGFLLYDQAKKRQGLKSAEYIPTPKEILAESLPTTEQYAKQTADPDKIWITVYKDTLDIRDDLDNLTEICIPTEWPIKELEAEGESDLERWLNEYTADSTEFIARDALSTGKILACDDLNLFLLGEEKELNTRIEYLYRDADNYKVWNDCIIKGTLSEEQKQTILDCRDEGEYFIPHLVGLPETRFGNWDDQSDHEWFELWDDPFRKTTDPATVDITAEALVNRFLAFKEGWCAKPDLNNLISGAQNRIRSTNPPPEHHPER